MNSPSGSDTAMPRRGLMLVLSSPSGAGKTTIARRLLEEDPNLTISVSATTRPMRPGEVDGKDYIFVDQDKFDQMRRNSEFLEYATVFDNSYGTPKAAVAQALVRGEDVLFDVDWQGTQQLRANAREDLVSIFILPPSIEELESRLRGRNQDPEEVVRKRMDRATSEMSHHAEYDYLIVNDDLERAISDVRTILNAERLKHSRRIGVVDFVRGMGMN